MWKRILIIGGALLLIVGLFVLAGVLQRSKSRRALSAYLAQLKAQGEPLTWADLGYPPSGDTNTSMDAFLAAVHSLGSAHPNPGELVQMHFVAPGKAQVAWASPLPLLSSTAKSSTNAPAWEQLTADMVSASNALTAIRQFLECPPRHFPMNVTNPLASGPRNPFVEKRNAAQWLAADCLAALHQGDVARAHLDLHGLSQLAQLHRDDPLLVTAMIRVAISGLGLGITWEALQANGWNDEMLAAVQQDWEGIDLTDALRLGMLGERAHALQLFEQLGVNGSNPAALLASTSTGSGTSWSLADLPEAILQQASGAYWRSHMEEDQLLYLQVTQERLDLLRRFGTNAPGHEVRKEFAARNAEFEALISSPWNRYRYLLTGIAMPNYGRAMEVVFRNETQRRMTILAIALQRYHLRTGQLPSTLDELVPECVSECPIDPMSGQPFGYRRNSNGTFTLYSVGEDGVEDGGDATATNATKQFDLWSGRDAVWPDPVFPEETSNP